MVQAKKTCETTESYSPANQHNNHSNTIHTFQKIQLSKRSYPPFGISLIPGYWFPKLLMIISSWKQKLSTESENHKIKIIQKNDLLFAVLVSLKWMCMYEHECIQTIIFDLLQNLACRWIISFLISKQSFFRLHC